MRRISTPAWEQLRSSYKGGPELQPGDACPTCLAAKWVPVWALTCTAYTTLPLLVLLASSACRLMNGADHTIAVPAPAHLGYGVGWGGRKGQLAKQRSVSCIELLLSLHCVICADREASCFT